MVQPLGRRLGLLPGLTVAALLACAPASAKAPPADGGTATGRDGGTASTEAAKPDSAQATEGGSCTGKATFCAVYGQTFCGSQPGCTWSFASRTCNGLALKCETATNAAFCRKIKGCKWQ